MFLEVKKCFIIFIPKLLCFYTASRYPISIFDMYQDLTFFLLNYTYLCTVIYYFLKWYKLHETSHSQSWQYNVVFPALKHHFLRKVMMHLYFFIIIFKVTVWNFWFSRKYLIAKFEFGVLFIVDDWHGVLPFFYFKK